MDLIESLLSAFWTIITSLPGLFAGAIDFIIVLFVKLPVLITDNLFIELPFVFRYGLMGCFGIVILIASLKLLKLLKLS